MCVVPTRGLEKRKQLVRWKIPDRVFRWLAVRLVALAYGAYSDGKCVSCWMMVGCLMMSFALVMIFRDCVWGETFSSKTKKHKKIKPWARFFQGDAMVVLVSSDQSTNHHNDVPFADVALTSNIFFHSVSKVHTRRWKNNKIRNLV